MPLRSLILATCLTLIFSSTHTLSATSDNPELQSLVDQLREITQRAREQRAADRWLLNELDDLVSRHDWPWRNALLSEDFSDGNYDRDPAWDVISGQFWVDGRLGLRSRSEAEIQTTEEAAPQQKQDLGKALLGALLQEALKDGRDREPEPSTTRRNEPAEIQLALQIPTVFALQLEFSAHNPPGQGGQLAFGLYQGREGNTGYQLLLALGDTPTLELLSRINGRTRVIDRIALDGLSDGGSHSLEWRRDGNGQIEVLMDGTARVQVRDHSFRHPFQQFSILNQAGDFAISTVTLHGG